VPFVTSRLLMKALAGIAVFGSQSSPSSARASHENRWAETCNVPKNATAAVRCSIHLCHGLT